MSTLPARMAMLLPASWPRAMPLPGRGLALGVAILAVLAAAALAVLQWLGLPAGAVGTSAAFAGALLAAAFAIDVACTWHRLALHPVALERRLPAALSLGQPARLAVRFAHAGPWRWRVRWFDHAPASLALRGLPGHVDLPPASAVDTGYEVTPTRRGVARFEPATVRVRSRWGLAELELRLGATRGVQVLPNFAALSRYAWLAGDRRLAEIGIKNHAALGAGTDFKQLGEYVPGTPTRPIDWKATLRHGRAVVREFQDDRDQAVFFLLDCGRRMKADERANGQAGASHFDRALDAMLLLAYVALKSGDAVGAMTFAQEPAEPRMFAPAKGAAALQGLVARLHDVEPGPAHPDYLAAARELMRRLPRRSLVVVLTNFRDVDGEELRAALGLLRTRHLVLLASLTEGVVAQIREQRLGDARAAWEVASAHWFEQARSDAFRRLAEHDQLLVDVAPETLAAALVNRYRETKRSRRL